MSKADDITHYRVMTHLLVDELADKLRHPLNCLGIIAQSGGFIADETTDEMQLARDAATLRMLADVIMQRRAALLANEQHTRIAAE